MIIHILKRFRPLANGLLLIALVGILVLPGTTWAQTYNSGSYGDGLYSTGGATQSDTTVNSGGGGGGRNTPTNDPLLISQLTQQIAVLRAQLNALLAARNQGGTTNTAPASSFDRDLYLYREGEDVKRLQVFLNNHGYLLASSGLGSPGQETEFYGRLTQEALARFQKANNISPALGYFGPVTRQMVNTLVAQ